MTDKLKPGDFIKYKNGIGEVFFGQIVSLDVSRSFDSDQWDYLIEFLDTLFWPNNEGYYFKHDEIQKLEGPELAKIKALYLLNQ